MSDTQAAAPAAPAATSTPDSAPAEEISQEASSEETVEQIQQENPELTKAEAKKMLRELKIKFDGKELTETLPFDIPDEPEAIEYMRKKLQMDKLAQSRSKETADLKKDVEAFFKALTGDTKRVLKELGIDPKKFAEDVINEEITEMQKSPEQKEREKLTKELEDMRKKLKDEEEAKKSAEMSRMQEKFAVELDQDITEALTNSNKLPKSPYVVKRIADAMLLAYKNGYTTATAKDIIPLVEKEISEEIQGMFGAAPEDAMEAILGKSNLDRLRKSRLQKAKKAVETASQIKQTGNEVKSEKKDAKKVSYKDFFSKI